MTVVDDMEIVDSGAALGAEIRGVDLSRPLDDAGFRHIEAAFNAHSVLCFRGQDLTPEQHIAFASRFGQPQNLFLNYYAMPGYPEIVYVSNIQENGRDIGHRDAGRVWHSDMSYEPNPPRATLLHAREIPVTADGTVLGDTLFASAVAGYDSLDEASKARLAGLRVTHDVAGRRRKTGTGTREDDKIREAKPKVVHPAVRTHPFTGRKSINLVKGECVAIDGMAQDDALALIDEMAETVIRDEFVYRHKWQLGDVLIWDNCAVQHLAIHDYEPPLRRMMWRITVGYTEVYE
jgi:taurine dioxygenase